MFEIVTMKKMLKSYTFIVYADGSFQETTCGKKSGYFPDFAETFLALKSKGFKVV